MNHVLLGASVPFAVACLLYALRGGRAGLPLLVLTPLAMALAGLWAVIPDIPRMLGMEGLYLRMMSDPRCDWFLWHHTIDAVETESSLYAVGIVLLAAALLAAALRELTRAEAVRR